MISKKNIKTKLSISILLILLTSVVIVHTYCQKKYDEKIRKFYIDNANRKAVYLAFLVHKKDKELQSLLVDILREDLIWMNNTSKNNKEFSKICVGWKDILFKKAIKEKQNVDLKKVFKRLKQRCQN